MDTPVAHTTSMVSAQPYLAVGLTQAVWKPNGKGRGTFRDS